MEKSYVKNASDKAQVRSSKRKSKLDRMAELDQIRAIAALPNSIGLRFFWRYLTGCGVFRSTFTGRSDTFFLEGQRYIGLQLLSDINEADPRIYVAMINLHKDEEEENGRASKRAGAGAADDGDLSVEPGSSDWDYEPAV